MVFFPWWIHCSSPCPVPSLACSSSTWRMSKMGIQHIWLVVSTPLKNMSSSVGMMTFPIYGKINMMFQTTNQIFIYIYVYIICTYICIYTYTICELSSNRGMSSESWNRNFANWAADNGPPTLREKTTILLVRSPFLAVESPLCWQALIEKYQTTISVDQPCLDPPILLIESPCIFLELKLTIIPRPLGPYPSASFSLALISCSWRPSNVRFFSQPKRCHPCSWPRIKAIDIHWYLLPLGCHSYLGTPGNCQNVARIFGCSMTVFFFGVGLVYLLYPPMYWVKWVSTTSKLNIIPNSLLTYLYIIFISCKQC